MGEDKTVRSGEKPLEVEHQRDPGRSLARRLVAMVDTERAQNPQNCS
jgi:hypothetical protein